jgi:hypothetical protein
MMAVSLAGHYGRTIVIDVCHGCNHVWFDAREDLNLSPGAVVQLFEALGRAAQTARLPVAARKPCPRCGTGLLRTHDRVKATRYEFFRCSRDHGRLMSFGTFLRAKHFVRDLTDEEVRTLRVDARVIKCVNCGAATDISADAVCQYCKSPIAVLDADQLTKTLAALEQAEAKRTTLDPTWPLRVEQARRQTEAAFAQLQREHGAAPDFDLVELGLAQFAKIARGLLDTARRSVS